MEPGLVKGFLIGFNVATFSQIVYYSVRKCYQCGKKYWRKKSTCKKYPALFCSEICDRLYTMDLLLKKGCNPEVVVRVISGEPISEQ